MLIHHKPKPKKPKSSTETFQFTEALKKHGLHYACVSKATIGVLLEIQAEPLPVAKKVKGQHNIKSPSSKVSIGPLVTNKFVELKDDFYRVTWKGDFYIKQLKEAGLVGDTNEAKDA